MGKETIDHRSPRLYVEDALAEGSVIVLGDDQSHYLKNVLRRPDGSQIRVFNGRDGEFISVLQIKDKKTSVLALSARIIDQPRPLKEIHLAFAPIKKDRQDFMIEKSVELGVTHFHPVLTQQTITRDLNAARIKKQIIEASEQCERLDIPHLSALDKLNSFLSHWPENTALYAAIERLDAPLLSKISIPVKCGFLIGPEGGFSDEEKSLLSSHKKITAVSLGDQILRAETAALYGMSILRVS